MPRALLGLAVPAVVSILSAGCYKVPEEPLKLEGNMLTVSNVSKDEWTHVEIWLNQNFRMITPSIRPGGRVQATLGTFVTGFGQRINFNRMQVKDDPLIAQRPERRG